MGLRAKFSLAVFAAFLIGVAIAAVVLQFVFVADARLQVVQNVRIMMSAADAVRHYMDQQVAPVGGKFETALGVFATPPAHVNCRCWLMFIRTDGSILGSE